MSGLEAAAFVLNATDASYKAIAAAIEYGQKVKAAKACTENIQSDVHEITNLLDDLHLRACKAKESDDASQVQQWTSLRDIDSRDSPVSQIRLELNTIQGLLTTQKLSKIEHLLWPRKMKKVEKSMLMIAKQKERLSEKMRIDTGFQTIDSDKKIAKIARDSRSFNVRRAIKWLSDFDHTVYHQEACKEHMETTGEWILDRPDFLSWKTSKGGFLWIYGPAGCGKTILSSTIINALQSDCDRQLDEIAIYFYFKDGQRQGATDMLSSIAKQLCLKAKCLPEGIENNLQKKYKNGERLDESSLIKIIQALIEDAGAVYLVIDALDECVEVPYLLKLLNTLSKLKLETARILMTSRDLPEIRRSMNTVATVSIPIGSSERKYTGIDNDIDLFIRQSLVDQYYLSMRAEKIKSKIIEALVINACGMFRWVTCQLDQLSKPLSDDDLLEALGDLPKDLDETYERMLRMVLKSGEKQTQMALNLLKWLVSVYEPLTVEQAAEAVLQDVASCSLTKRLPIVDATVEICAGLVKKVEREKGETIEFVHFSVKEYLVSERIKSSLVSSFYIDIQRTRQEIAQICLTFIFLFDQPDFRIMKIKDAHPLLLYICKHWLRHFKEGKGQEEKQIRDLAYKLFDLDRQRFFIMCLAMGSDRSKSGSIDSQLYYAIESGLDEVVRTLLQRGADPNAGKGCFGYALHVAALYSSEEIVSLLLKHNVDVNLRAGMYNTALIAACWKRRVNVVNLLLNHGADPNLVKGISSPLGFACWNDDSEVLQKLLEKGVSQEECEENLWIPAQQGYDTLVNMLLQYTNRRKLINPHRRSIALYRACSNGHVEICRQLLKEDVDVNVEYTPGVPTPLQAATEHGNESVVEILLSNGANANQQCGYYGSALQIATFKGNNNIVKMLMDRGADPNCLVGRFGTALCRAVAGGHMSTTRLLLEHNADIHIRNDEDYGSAFHYAVVAGLTDYVKLFLEHGANIDKEGGKTGLTVTAAILAKHQDIVELLLEGDSPDGVLAEQFGSVLHGAAATGDEQRVRMLIENGYDVNLERDSWLPVQAAVNNGRTSIAKFLIEKGADINFSGLIFDNVLHDAAYHGKLDICKLLIEYKAPINRLQGKYGTALQAASYNGHTKVVQLLLKCGADVNLIGGKYGSPLAAAFSTRNSSGSTVRLLLEHGADPNFRGGEYGSLLQAACYGPRSYLIPDLLDAGPDLDYQGGSHPSPIEILHEKNRKSLVKELIIRGAKVPPSLESKYSTFPRTLQIRAYDHEMKRITMIYYRQRHNSNNS